MSFLPDDDIQNWQEDVTVGRALNEQKRLQNSRGETLGERIRKAKMDLVEFLYPIKRDMDADGVPLNKRTVTLKADNWSASAYGINRILGIEIEWEN